jgi:hypothetical protein
VGPCLFSCQGIVAVSIGIGIYRLVGAESRPTAPYKKAGPPLWTARLFSKTREASLLAHQLAATGRAGGRCHPQHVKARGQAAQVQDLAQGSGGGHQQPPAFARQSGRTAGVGRPVRAGHSAKAGRLSQQRAERTCGQGKPAQWAGAGQTSPRKERLL